MLSFMIGVHYYHRNNLLGGGGSRNTRLIDIRMNVCVTADVAIGLLAEHYRLAALQRDKLYEHGAKAKYYPQKYASFMLDGMTKRTTSLPRNRVKAKHWESKIEDQVPNYENALMGSHIEGLGYFCDFHSLNIKDGANFCCDIIHRNIARLQQHNLEKNLPNPPVLYVQLDNCNTNKSKLLFVYLSYLVHTGVFEKIKVGFLLVGHTHEFIDQFFSR